MQDRNQPHVEQQTVCPICAAQTYYWPRYPNHICQTCQARLRSTDGRPIKYFNVSMSGGFTGRYADSDELYERHECFIDGIACYANEAYLGGIVVQLLGQQTS